LDSRGDDVKGRLMDKKEPASKLAAAIRYDPKKDGAPKVTAKGRGHVAEKILAIAAEHNIPIRSEPDMAKMLCLLNLDEEIPVELYRAVAEILAFVYSTNEKMR